MKLGWSVLMKKFTALFLFVLSLNFNIPHAIADSCDASAGMFDSNVLALSSQPGFCQTYGYEAGKPECVHLSKNSYQAKHLTLHGLWPNQNACGQRYGFCGVQQQNHHCSYSPVDLSSNVSENLKKIMPGYKYGSCLERHEWNKHGSCQILSADDYFALAMRLALEADQSVFGQYITQNQGKTVRLSMLREMIAQAFGKKNSGRIYLGCKNGVLVDIYIQLPASISLDESLESLIDRASNYQYRDSCSSNVKISDFNKENIVAMA
jgi:ribonuclease T2